MFAGSTALGPIVHHLWVYAGSANANYFFAINLVFGTAQVRLILNFIVGSSSLFGGMFPFLVNYFRGKERSFFALFWEWADGH